jgi:hypothetical protein
MRLIIIPIFIIILTSACSNSQQQSDSTSSSFRTTAPSLLYFKNMRSIYYEMEELKGSRIEMYQLKQFRKDTEKPILYPVIANDWLNDRAYLLLKTNDFIHGFGEPLAVRIVEQDKLISLASPSPQDQYEMATLIYEALRAGHSLEVTGADEVAYPLFDDNLDVNHYLATFKDYLRLIEAS